jgi:large subunit ribosomal protein L10
MNKAHVSEEKKQELILIKKLLKEYPVVAIIDLTNLPSAQMQGIRAKLKGMVLIKSTKKAVLQLALEALKEERKGIEQLEPLLDKGIPALLLSKEDAFKVYKKLKASKTMAAAKPGQIAPYDLIVSAGPTQFPPGPIIGELGQAGIIASVVDGKVTVKKDTVLVKEGQIIDAKKSGVLAKLGIEPMEIGVNVVGAYQDGVLFTHSVLDVDEKEYIEQIKQISRNALALTLTIGYVTKDNIKLLIGNAHRDAFAVASSKDIMTSETLNGILAKAENQAIAVKSKIPDNN